MMRFLTVKEAFDKGKKSLELAGLFSPAFDALCLLGQAFGVHGRAELAVRGSEIADQGALEFYNELIIRRTREPLQYILGRWDFDGMSLSVGKGVLIPREDTVTLVETACEMLAGTPAPRVLDLCAGSGAVGLAIARRTPGAHVTCVEKSPEALPYLRKNIEEFGHSRVECVVGDVLVPPSEKKSCDCIVSNPPYIPSGDIDSLAWEVNCEPRMALDGGGDGLLFYRAICSMWRPLIRAGGFIAFEVGYDIRDGVIEIMRANGIERIDAAKDINGIDRCVFGTVVS